MDGMATPMVHDIYIDISTLMEPHWTGIAVVTAEISRYFRERYKEAVHFMIDGMIVRPSLVDVSLQIGDSIGLRVFCRNGDGHIGRIDELDAHLRARSTAIYPNFKRGVTRFGREILFVHDISFATMPELHDAYATNDYRRRLYFNCLDADVIMCNSLATKLDLETYFGIDKEKIVHAHLGCRSVRPEHGVFERIHGGEEFFLVLGTVEPRKNIEMVLRYISNNIGSIGNRRFLFVGREGWGDKFKDLLLKYRLEDQPCIRHLGFVSEGLKWALLQRAKAVIYPSLFEGFGLPVVEGMRARSLVCAGLTSSVGELGIERQFLFDPCDEAQFSYVMSRVVRLSERERIKIGLENYRNSLRFDWGIFGEKLADLAFACGESGVESKSGDSTVVAVGES